MTFTATDETSPARHSGLGTWLKKRAAPLIVFALLFAFWESAVYLTGIKEYLLPPPSKVWTEFLKRSDTVIAGAWVTTQEIIAGYLLAIVVSVPLALSVRLFALRRECDLSSCRVPADHSEDRDRAAVHHLVRLRIRAEAAAGLPALVLPDRGREYRRLQVGRSGDYGFRAHDRRRGLEDVCENPPPTGASRIFSPG